MNDLYRALGDINSIRRQVANSTEFRGYGPATLATTAAFAIAAAGLQQLLLPDAANHIAVYLCIWTCTAFLSAALTGQQMRTRSRRIHSALSNEMMSMALEQFAPSLITGLLLTIVLVGSVPSAVWMLPGLWQLLFSLGIFSSCRFLPKAMLAAGAWYLLTGLTCLATGEVHPLSPFEMGVSFGAGQLLIAAILRFCSPEVTSES